MNQSGLSFSQLDAIAVTTAPGLAPCLRVGISHAKALSLQHRKPLACVHHLEAHALMARLPSQAGSEVRFPFLLLLVSGGHSQLLLCKDLGDYVHIGGTLDDSLGEAFDKAARCLGLPFEQGGGRALELLALQGDPSRHPLPVAMRQRRNCDLSFAGMKSALARTVERLVREHPPRTSLIQESSPSELSLLAVAPQVAADLAASFQLAVVTQVEERVHRAVKLCAALPEAERPRSLVVSGGVASNKYLRTRLVHVCGSEGVPVHFPPIELCTDNGVMIAWAALEYLVRARIRPGALPSDAPTRVLHSDTHILKVRESPKCVLGKQHASLHPSTSEAYPSHVQERRLGQA